MSIQNVILFFFFSPLLFRSLDDNLLNCFLQIVPVELSDCLTEDMN